MRNTPIPSSLFVKNRTRLMEIMDKGAAAVIGSNSRKLRNGDQYYPYRQHSDFFYLTGIDQGESLLLIAPDQEDDTLREILFLHTPSEKMVLWSGAGLSKREATQLSGISHIREGEDFEEVMMGISGNIHTLYTSGDIPRERIDELFPELAHAGLAPLTTRLRMVKEEEELEVIRSACAITGSAFNRVLGRISPDMWEYEVEAEIIAEFISRGASGHAFEPIIASGKNALTLHYTSNNDRCREGDLLLMDFGAEYHNYAADCSRTIPVSGRYTKRQRQVYEAVTRIFKKAKELIVPGAMMSEFHHQVGELFQEEHIALGLYTLKQARESPRELPFWKNYFMHGTSHSLGLDVHDPCDRSIPFRPGMVITCEPAIYIQEEGFGIRVENDILISDNGPVDLMEEIPMEAGEIEEIIHSNR
ncbi:MAG: aminopeptidase P N-terminal domain-containing protein [Bacteroidales bacterium]